MDENLNGVYNDQNTAGVALKDSIGWITGVEGKKTYDGTNEFGFSALPSGYYMPGFDDRNDKFLSEGEFGYFWSATEKTDKFAYYVSLSSYDAYAILYEDSKGVAFSVRCVQNNQ